MSAETKNNSANSSAGFTLVELMVVMSIMVILTSVIIANFSNFNQTRNLTASRDVLVADLRKSQSLALSSKDAPTSRPSAHYGAAMSRLSATPFNLISIDNTGVTSTLEQVKLQANVHISSFQVVNSAGTTFTPDAVTVYFSVPYSRTLFSYNSVYFEKDSTLTIVLSTDDGHTKSIIIDGITGNIKTP